MNSSQPTRQQVSGSTKTAPVLLNAEALKNVAGGVATSGVQMIVLGGPKGPLAEL